MRNVFYIYYTCWLSEIFFSSTVQLIISPPSPPPITCQYLSVVYSSRHCLMKEPGIFLTHNVALQFTLSALLLFVFIFLFFI
jgi:hypothetical protein